MSSAKVACCAAIEGEELGEKLRASALRAQRVAEAAHELFVARLLAVAAGDDEDVPARGARSASPV
jgi:hypothetical protein